MYIWKTSAYIRWPADFGRISNINFELMLISEVNHPLADMAGALPRTWLLLPGDGYLQVNTGVPRPYETASP